LQQQWLVVGLIFVAVWLTWGAYELHGIFPNAEEFHAMVISGAVGGIIGGVIGSTVYRRNQRELGEIIDQIEDLMEGEEE
jgi:membrane associated rhomboid family serine protease